MTLRQENKGLYWAWKAMKQRCNNPKCQAYRNYGARGISVCDEWNLFEPFCEWALNNGYQKGLDLDRTNNDGNYEPGNCRWVTRETNTNNRRCSRYVVIGNEKLTVAQWARKCGVSHELILGWLKHHGEDYAIGRIIEIQTIGYTPKDYSRNHTKKITHVETGITFNSVKEAALHFGIGKSTISNAMRWDRRTAAGHFEWYVGAK